MAFFDGMLGCTASELLNTKIEPIAHACYFIPNTGLRIASTSLTDWRWASTL